MSETSERTLTIRPALEADTDALLAMGLRFIAESSYHAVLEPVPAHLERVVAYLLTEGGCWVLETPEGQVVGMLGLGLAPLPLSGELAALEVMWWVEPEWRGGRAGLHLWAVAEPWARAHDATCLVMVQPAGEEPLTRLYRRRGYVPLETSWIKRLEASDGAEGNGHGANAVRVDGA